jgi:ubiquitin carboxyl-terminal hydrolase L3
MARNERGIHYREDGTKTFIPLENNPEVFTELVHKLGVSPKLGFYDVYNIDEPELLAMVPRPVHALIFIAPADVYYRVRGEESGGKEVKTDAEGGKKLTYDGSGEGEPVMWFVCLRSEFAHAITDTVIQVQANDRPCLWYVTQ